LRKAEELRLLHLHSSFHPGGKELRAAQLINAFGNEFEHTIVSGQPDSTGAAKAIDAVISVGYPKDFPPLAGQPVPARLRQIAQALKPFDLILTYNWGAMDAVMAHAVFGKAFDLPPLVHHEDGFNEDEATRLKTSRNLFRRVALTRASRLVVPSLKLEQIALKVWQQPPQRVKRIGNGIDTAAYSIQPAPDAVPGLTKRPDEFWLGTLAGLRSVKNLPRLVRAFDGLPSDWRLVILGEGPERGAIMAEAAGLGLADRVHLPGFVADPAKVIGLFDLFALSSDSEQFPISVVEAMAAGLSVVSPDVGDVAEMVSAANRAFITPRGDEAAFASAIGSLATAAQLRQSVGEANRVRAVADFDEQSMVNSYRAVYHDAIYKGRWRC
jgi:L-malate glycosyltransferase